MKKPDYIIGIDPDCEKSGFALLNIAEKRYSEVGAYTFPILLYKIDNTSTNISCERKTILVIVEAGWLNESNWHLSRFDSKQKAAAKGNAVGRNHETGRKIAEMARHYGLEVIEQRPLRKCWSGPDGKITHEEISQFIPGFPSRSNQEVRDAALLAWYHAGFPIRVKSKPKNN